MVRARSEQKLRAMTTIVTGGAGFVGSHLVDALVARDERVLVLDDLSTGSRDNIADALASGKATFVEVVTWRSTPTACVRCCARRARRARCAGSITSRVARQPRSVRRRIRGGRSRSTPSERCR